MRKQIFLTLLLAAIVAWPSVAPAAVVVETVPVGNAGNAADPCAVGYAAGLGAVSYRYQMGKYEITNVQYAEFLNAVARVEDTHGLWDSMMQVGSYGNALTGITRNGSAPSYSYSVQTGFEGLAVNYVGFGDAARFANWMHNGQPSGPGTMQNASTTEDGSYALFGTTGWSALGQIYREPDATWVLPTADEWYKAGHYNGATDTYNAYALGSDNTPVPETPAGGADSANLNYAMALPGGLELSTLSPAGAYTSAMSPYGAMDMVGNVLEFCETNGIEHIPWANNWKVMMGSSWTQEPWVADSHDLDGDGYTQVLFVETGQNYPTGFRLGNTIPEPFTMSLLAIGGLVLIRRKK